jgi:hypothetical protein
MRQRRQSIGNMQVRKVCKQSDETLWWEEVLTADDHDGVRRMNRTRPDQNPASLRLYVESRGVARQRHEINRVRSWPEVDVGREGGGEVIDVLETRTLHVNAAKQFVVADPCKQQKKRASSRVSSQVEAELGQVALHPLC